MSCENAAQGLSLVKKGYETEATSDRSFPETFSMTSAFIFCSLVCIGIAY